MRIHRLRLQGIGPYAEAQDVDMDRLNQAGLFLLDGPTGAGKSTILSALCYALYGSVPGGRSPESLVTTLREVGSVLPEVLVEFTVQGRRFEVIRSPKHERLKKRGQGTTPTQASVSLREHVDGAWESPLTRADEVGQQIQDVMHLDAAQFMQVVMLPQGQFAEFLRAKSDDRQKLLRRLFGTQRFDGVEAQLKAKVDALGAKVAADSQTAESAREQLRSIAAEELGAEWYAPDPFPESDEELVALTAARAEAARQSAEKERDVAAADERGTRTALTALEQTAAALRAAEAWRQREVVHRQQEEAVAQDRAAVEAHTRAAPVVAAADRLQQARAAASRSAETVATADEDVARDALAAGWIAEAQNTADAEAESAAAESVDAAGTGGAETGADRARAAGRLADRALDAHTQALGDVRTVAALEREQQEATDRVSALKAEQDSAEQERQAREAALTEVRERIDAGTARTGAKDAVAARVKEAEARHAAAERAEECAAAEAKALAAREKKDQARQAALKERADLATARYEQAAGDLAERLEPGEPCAVCGSPEHPDPAPRTGREVTEADVAKAEKKVVAADAAVTAAEQALTAAREQTRAARAAAAGLSVADAVAALETARAESAEVAAAAKSLAADRRRLTVLEKEHSAAAAADTARAAAQARLAEAGEHRARRLTELRAAVARAQADAQDLEARGAVLRVARGRLQRLADVLEAQARAQAVVTNAEAAVAAALAEHGAEDLAAVRAARLPAEDTAARQAQVRDWDAEQARLAELAASEPVRRGRALQEEHTAMPSEEDLARAAESLAAAEQRREAAQDVVVRHEGTIRSLERQAAQLREVLGRSADLLEDYERARGLLDLVRGQGENQLKMPLASYVLAGRLEEVAAAATERLLAMTDGRYAIEYSDTAAGRGNKGLELVIRDSYVDETRHPSTLSGGETFMASLALALGLADTVQAESGGIELDTLFVDEGFGSLDSETLDDVLDVVDALRSGGRTVGLVSHVERMRQEIPVRLAVTKEREGSSLMVVDGL